MVAGKSTSTSAAAGLFKADNGDDLDVGQFWVYRQGARGAIACVRVMKLGTSRPLRVCVRFVEDKYEGKEEWVPPARLKVPWDQMDAWRRKEDRWAAVRAVSGDRRDTPEYDAAGRVRDSVPDANYARWGLNRDSGVLVITDVERLLIDLGLDRRILVDDPVSFTDHDGSLVVPWRVAQQVAQAIARNNVDRVLAQLEQDEHDNRLAATKGRRYGSTFISAETCAKVFAESAPARELVREWCGVSARDRRDELNALRAEVTRLGKLIEQAVGSLRDAGAKKAARQLERDLGVPVDQLRQRQDRR